MQQRGDYIKCAKRQAQILDQGASTQHNKRTGSEDIEVFISCFGILMDTKIIKFNLMEFY